MKQFVHKRYRVGATPTRFAVSSALILITGIMMIGITTACTGFADQVRHQEASEPRGMEAATLLYESMVAVFEGKTEGVDIEYEEQWTVISHFEDLGDERRRRFVGRVVPVGGGIGVQITAEYQVETTDEGEDVMWKDEPRVVVEEEAAPDELSLARRVERLYNQGGP